MQRHRTFRPEQAEIRDRDTRWPVFPLGSELHDIPRRETETDMLIEASGFLRRSPGMPEQPSFPFETAQQLEEVEILGERGR